MGLQETIGKVIARAIAARATEGAFGVLVSDVRGFSPEALVQELASPGGPALRLAMPGFPAAEARRLRDVARRAGFTDESFTTTVEGAERWRNDARVQETIAVVAPRELPKLHSLNRFTTLTGAELYERVCAEAAEASADSSTLRDLWAALRRREVQAVVPLQSLLAFYDDLATSPLDQRVGRAGGALFLLGLLPDEGLLINAPAAVVARRLTENARLVDQLAVLSRADRQRIARALAGEPAESGADQLRVTYQRVMAFHREQDPARLRELTVGAVQRLLKAQPAAPSAAAAPKAGAPRGRPRPAARLVEFLIDGDDASAAELASTVEASLEGDGGDVEAVDPASGETLDIEVGHPLMRLIERCVGAERWGAVITTDAPTIEQAVSQLDLAEIRLFGPQSDDWIFRDMLVQLVTEFSLERELLVAFDQLCEARRTLAAGLPLLLTYPELHVNRSLEHRAAAERYLAAYDALAGGLKRSFEAVAQVAPEGIETLCAQLLAWDTIFLRTAAGWKAVLSPLHPLHLWKYVELSRRLRIHAGVVSAGDRELLRARIEELPNFITTVHVSRYVSGGENRLLPEAGAARGLPLFEEDASSRGGRDAVPELVALLGQFCTLHPHARLGLRVALVDPPDIDALLRQIGRLYDESRGDLGAVHVRVFSTRRRVLVSAVGGAEDEEGVERFRGAGANAPLTLEVRDEALPLASIATELAEKPAHVTFYFNPSTAKTQHFPRTLPQSLSPLCLPMQYSYDRLTKSVRIVPAADGGAFSNHNDLRSRVAHHLASSFFGVVAELRAERRELARLAEGTVWLALADQPQSGAHEIGVPRLSLQRGGTQDVAVYARDPSKFVAILDSQLRRFHQTPTRAVVERLVNDLRMLRPDGLLSLLDELGGRSGQSGARAWGVVCALVTVAWLRSQSGRRLVVSLDDPTTRRWLELAPVPPFNALLSLSDEDDGVLVVETIAVASAPPAGEPQGEVERPFLPPLLKVEAAIREILSDSDDGDGLLSGARREVLRRLLFHECFFDGRSEADKLHWSRRLNDLFGRSARLRFRPIVVSLGVASERPSGERLIRLGDREVRAVSLSEAVVRRYLGDPGASTSGGPRAADVPRTKDDATTPHRERRSAMAKGEARGAPPERTPEGPAPRPTTSEGAEADLVSARAAELLRALTENGFFVQELDPRKAQVGPAVIRFRVRFRTGTKLALLRARAEDIGRELATRATPLIDNVSGENYIGIDLERPEKVSVSLWPVLESLTAGPHAGLPIAAGVTPSGEPVVLDLTELPHLLVAGSTMSGKTMFLHAVVLSLLATQPPEKVELLVIDPKATDFAVYNGLKHLRGGRVVTEPEVAVDELRALVDEELSTRTRVLQDAQRPHIADYNATGAGPAMRYLVVVIDEYADLVASLPKRDRADFERDVARLAHRARSVGIHLVLATQRPSAEVLTGDIKANMPTRISFRLPQRVDSMTILDQPGAENLLGRGDMLVMRDDKLVRAQGFFAPPAEVATFIDRRGLRGPPAARPDRRPAGTLDLVVDDSDAANHRALIGEATALAATADEEGLAGGRTLTVEAELKPGRGEELMCRAGEVLKKSAKAAWRYVQIHAKEYGVDGASVLQNGVSVQIVNHAEYRDGPSAGIALITAMMSALTNRAVRPGLAMTGQVSLKGKVGRVGGILQKVVAAHQRGRKTVIVPAANREDLAALPREIRERVEIVYVDDVREAIDRCLM